MEPKYVATRSALSEFSFFVCILLLILGIIPGVIYIAVKNASAHSHQILFYDDKYVLKSGIMNKHESEAAFKGVLAVSVDQSVKGRMFGYGNVKIDVVGKNNLVLGGVKDPQGLKKYLDSKKIKGTDLNYTVTN